MQFWHNGEFHPTSETTIHAAAAGLTLGWGVFTTLGIFNGRPFVLERHLQRLRQSAEATSIPCEYDDEAIATALDALIEHNQANDGVARLTLTRRGDGRWSQESGSDLSILAIPRSPVPSSGLKILLSSYRLDARRPLACIKTTSYLEHQWIWEEAHSHGYDEAIFCNSQGVLCEGARNNLFWVRDRTLYTPALLSGCLPGVGRALIAEWAPVMGINLREGAFSTAELIAADEVFLTTATTGPRPVQTFSDGPGGERFDFASPGDVTLILQERWAEETQKV